MKIILLSIFVGFLVQYIALVILFCSYGACTLQPHEVLNSPSGTIGITGEELSWLEEYIGGFVLFSLPFYITSLTTVFLTRNKKLTTFLVFTALSILGMLLLQIILQDYLPDISIYYNPLRMFNWFRNSLYLLLFPELPLIFTISLLFRLGLRLIKINNLVQSGHTAAVKS